MGITLVRGAPHTLAATGLAGTRVERFFRDITVNAIRRGVFTSVRDLVDAIDLYLIEHNQEPKPFIWTHLDQERL